MIERLVHALIASRNEAADDLLLEAMDRGNDKERQLALGAIIRRACVHGLGGVIDRYAQLPERLKRGVLENISVFGQALAEGAPRGHPDRQLAAMRLIAVGRQGRLAYVLEQNLNCGEVRVEKGAADALVAMARWAATETRRIPFDKSPASQSNEVLRQRGEIEEVVARALDRQRTFAAELLRAALLLADWPGSKTLAVLGQSKHGGRGAMERKLQQPPASENVEAFLLGASHGALRGSFAGAFARIQDRPVLDGMLRKTHWLKDEQLASCMKNVMGGRWMDEISLGRDIGRRKMEEVAAIGQWVAASGCAQVVKDMLLGRLAEKCRDDVDAKLRLLRIAMTRSESIQLVKDLLHDSDERIRRMAAREIVRRRPAGYQTLLLEAMRGAGASVRRVIGRGAGDVGFKAYWQRYERMDAASRKSAGLAVAKVVPDATRRLAVLLSDGPVGQRIKAMQMAQETGLVEGLRDSVTRLLRDEDARVRSKAVMAMGGLQPVPEDILVDRVMSDANARVRANAIEVLELARQTRLVPLFADRIKASNNRERANAIKALHHYAPSTATGALGEMLGDQRPMHRVSALWALRQIRWWQRLPEVGNMAKVDPAVGVRQYAIGVLKEAASEMKSEVAA